MSASYMNLIAQEMCRSNPQYQVAEPHKLKPQSEPKQETANSSSLLKTAAYVVGYAVFSPIIVPVKVFSWAFSGKKSENADNIDKEWVNVGQKPLNTPSVINNRYTVFMGSQIHYQPGEAEVCIS